MWNILKYFSSLYVFLKKFLIFQEILLWILELCVSSIIWECMLRPDPQSLRLWWIFIYSRVCIYSICSSTLFSTCSKVRTYILYIVGRGDALVESMSFGRRIAGSNPILTPRKDLGQVLRLQLPVALRSVNSDTASVAGSGTLLKGPCCEKRDRNG